MANERIIPSVFHRGSLLDRITAAANARRDAAEAFAAAWRAAGGEARADGPVVHVEAPAPLRGCYAPDEEAVEALRAGGVEACGAWMVEG